MQLSQEKNGSGEHLGCQNNEQIKAWCDGKMILLSFSGLLFVCLFVCFLLTGEANIDVASIGDDGNSNRDGNGQSFCIDSFHSSVSDCPSFLKGSAPQGQTRSLFLCVRVRERVCMCV